MLISSSALEAVMACMSMGSRFPDKAHKKKIVPVTHILSVSSHLFVGLLNTLTVTDQDFAEGGANLKSRRSSDYTYSFPPGDCEHDDVCDDRRNSRRNRHYYEIR